MGSSTSSGCSCFLFTLGPPFNALLTVKIHPCLFLPQTSALAKLSQTELQPSATVESGCLCAPAQLTLEDVQMCFCTSTFATRVLCQPKTRSLAISLRYHMHLVCVLGFLPGCICCMITKLYHLRNGFISSWGLQLSMSIDFLSFLMFSFFVSSISSPNWQLLFLKIYFVILILGGTTIALKKESETEILIPPVMPSISPVHRRHFCTTPGGGAVRPVHSHVLASPHLHGNRETGELCWPNLACIVP